jgi:hypothetical protein
MGEFGSTGSYCKGRGKSFKDSGIDARMAVAYILQIQGVRLHLI